MSGGRPDALVVPQAASGGGGWVNLCVMAMMAITAWDGTIYMACLGIVVVAPVNLLKCMVLVATD